MNQFIQNIKNLGIANEITYQEIKALEELPVFNFDVTYNNVTFNITVRHHLNCIWFYVGSKELIWSEADFHFDVRSRNQNINWKRGSGAFNAIEDTDNFLNVMSAFNLLEKDVLELLIEENKTGSLIENLKKTHETYRVIEKEKRDAYIAEEKAELSKREAEFNSKYKFEFGSENEKPQLAKKEIKRMKSEYSNKDTYEPVVRVFNIIHRDFQISKAATLKVTVEDQLTAVYLDKNGNPNCKLMTFSSQKELARLIENSYLNID